MRYEPDGEGYKVDVRAHGEESPQWIKVARLDDGTWRIVDDSMTTKSDDWLVEATALGFTEWDEGVTNLDTRSDGWQCFEISDELRFGEITLTPESFSGGTIDEVAGAASRVTWLAWCMGDI